MGDNKIKELLENNKKWSKDKNKDDKELFDKLKTQHPEVLWIGCADSRVPPELITQSGFGELFVHRNIANQFKPDDTNCMSVLEYAVKALKVSHIVICGHTGCGGAKNCFNQELDPNLIKWLEGIRELEAVNSEFSLSNPHFGSDEVQHKLVKANVVKQVEKISENHLVKSAKHKIQVHGFVFDLKDGLLEDLKLKLIYFIILVVQENNKNFPTSQQQKLIVKSIFSSIFHNRKFHLKTNDNHNKKYDDLIFPSKKFIINDHAIDKKYITSLGKTQGRLVILGSGWAGYKLLRDIDTKHHEKLFCFVIGTLEFRCIMEPIRRYSPKVQYYQAYADRVDLKEQILYCTSNLERNTDKFKLEYDTLIIAVGANSNTFGIPGVGEYALFLKDVSDARRIRQRVIECFEHASQPMVNEKEALGLLHFAIVGGGPTGIEFSAELHDFITEDMARLYPDLINSVTMTVYDVAPQILGSFDQSLRDYATKKFTRKGIKIRTGRSVLEVKERHMIIKEDGEVPYGMLVWATGITENPLTRSMSDQVMKDGSAKRLLTDEFLRVLDKESSYPFDNVFALGDCASIKDYDLPATAQVANQKALYLRKTLTQVAKNSGSLIGVKPFKFTNFGSMAYIGKKEALVDMTTVSKQIKESGFLAWIFWRSSYLTMTVSLRNKMLIYKAYSNYEPPQPPPPEYSTQYPPPPPPESNSYYKSDTSKQFLLSKL
nr:5762_t:CDS:10 [Entrophospora candida]